MRLNIFSSEDSTFVQRLYFIYSFGFLVARTVSVTLNASEINEESQKPTALLLSIPTEIYNVEVHKITSIVFEKKNGILFVDREIVVQDTVGSMLLDRQTIFQGVKTVGNNRKFLHTKNALVYKRCGIT